MRHHNSVFQQVLKLVPWGHFERLVDKHKADHRVRRLTTRNQFKALLFGQLAGAESLREIEAGLKSQSARLYHAGGRCVARTTLADANATRPAALYAEMFAHMADTAGRRTRRHIADAVRILDATRIRLSSLTTGWADAVRGAHALKLHVAYDPGDETPLSPAITGQKVNDITPAKAMPIEPGMTYVFDLAYYDFAWWAELDARGCRFVTRLKTNARLDVTAQQPVRKGSAILADRIGLLPQRMARSRRNPFTGPVREITVRIATGRIIRLVSNDLDAPAEDIADRYRQRWQIELFFKWIKQNLKIRRFIGTSENAVRTQIYVALIAYILLRAAQATQAIVTQPLKFTRLIRLNIMHRRALNALSEHKPPPPDDPRQMAFQLEPG